MAEKYRMKEYKRERLKYLTKELEKITVEMRQINDSLEQTYDRTSEIEALEYSYIKKLAEIMQLLGAEVKDVQLNPYGPNVPGISVN